MFKRPGDKIKKLARIRLWVNTVIAIFAFVIIIYITLFKLNTWFGFEISGGVIALIVCISIITLIMSLLSIYSSSLKMYGYGEMVNSKVYTNMKLNDISNQLKNGNK